MKRHTITVEEVDEFLAQPIHTEIAGSYGKGSHKSLTRVVIFSTWSDLVTVHYLLKDHDCTTKYYNLDLAVEAYNNII